MALQADLTLDIAQALAAAQQLGSVIDSVTQARLTLDTSAIAAAVTAAVDAADTQVTVQADTTDVTGSVDAAVEAADTEVTVEADVSDVTASVDAAVDRADPEVEVQADTSEIPADVEETVSRVRPPKVPIDGDTGPLEESIKDGLGAGEKEAPGAGSRAGGAFATSFARATQGALRNLPEVTIGADTSEADREIAGIRDELLRLSDQSIGVDISDDEAVAELARLQERLQALDVADVSPAVRVDVAAASAQLSSFSQQVDRVDSSVVDLGVAADETGPSMDELASSSASLDLGFAAAASSGGQLGGVFRALGAIGLGAGLFKAAQSASDLQESISKATVVFGSGIDEVRQFGSTAAESVGLSESAALEATATFGNLFVALGTTKAQATDLAPEVVGLAADLASFNNLGVDDTLEKLRSGLVGEIEPLRSLGISFGAAEVDAKAMELGLVGANGEITEGAKLQARWQLILEQSSTAQGDFARTSDGLANQQRILTAEFQDAVAELGGALLPALLDGVSIARSDLIPAFQEFGTQVLPALAKIFISLLPVAGGFTSLLVAMSPAVVAVAEAISAIPPELITLVGLFVAIRKFGSGEFLGGIVDKFNFVREAASPGKLLGGGIKDFLALNAVSIGASVALGAVALAFEENAKKAAEFKRQVGLIQSAISDSLEPGVTFVDGLAEAFGQLVQQGDTGAGVLAELGVSANEFAQAAAQSGGNSEAFADALGLTNEELGIAKLFLEQFNDQVSQAAEQQVEAIRASGDLSEAFVDQAIKVNTSKDKFGDITTTTVDYIGVLGALTDEQSRLAEQIGVTVDETGKLVEATGPAAVEADRLTLSLAQLRDGSGDFALELIGFADAAGGARIAEEDMQTAADQLGVSLDDLKTFVGSVNDAINQFAEDTLASVPSIDDIMSGLGDDFSAQGFVDQLADANEAIANFSENLTTLADFPGLQQAAAEQGPEFAAAFAEAIRSGNPEIAAAAEEQLGIYRVGLGGLEDQARNEIGPNVAEATGVIADLATQAFGDEFDIGSVAKDQAQTTIASVEDENANMATAGSEFGSSGKQGFKDGISGMSLEGAGEADLTIEQFAARQFAANLAGALFGSSMTAGVSLGVSGMASVSTASADRAGTAVKNKGPFAQIAGSIFGTGFTTGTGSGSRGMSAAAAASASSAVGSVKAQQKAAFSAGSGLGSAIGQGMQSGINAVAAAVASAAAALVQAAIARARSEAQTGSPSKLFAALGEDMAAGVVVGLGAGTSAVEDASAALVSAAADVATLTASDVSVRAFGDTDSSGGGIMVQGVAGMVQINMDGVTDVATARRVGDGAAAGFVDGLLARRVGAAARTS